LPGSLTSFSVEVLADEGSLYTIGVFRDDVPYMLRPGDGDASGSYGNRVAVSADEVVVAAPFALTGGAMYVYRLVGSEWIEQALFAGSALQGNDRFGHSLALDDGVLAVGAPGDRANGVYSGAVYVFERGPTGWTELARLTADNAGAEDQFGHSVTVHGGTLVVGAPYEDGDADGLQDSGAAYVFAREAGGWVQRGYLKAANTDAGDGFGAGVALHEGTLVVAAPFEDGGSPGVNGNADDESALDSGAVYVFEEAAGSWTQQAYLKASNPGGGTGPLDPGDQFGWGESMAGRGVAVFGNTIAVGAAAEDSAALGVNGQQNDESDPQSGAVYVFARTGASWVQEAYLKAAHRADSVEFGASVALWGDQLVVGTPQSDGGGYGVVGEPGEGGVVGSGAAHVFERSAGAWAQRFRLRAWEPAEDEFFGWNVAAAHGVIAVGTGYFGPRASAAYVFR
jgi:hypothetical protein